MSIKFVIYFLRESYISKWQGDDDDDDDDDGVQWFNVHLKAN